MKTHENNKNQFYKLIKHQRSIKVGNTGKSTVDGKDCYHGLNKMCDGWKKHFGKLATPQTPDLFDNNYYLDTQFDELILRDDFTCQEDGLHELSYRQVQKAKLQN